MLLFLAQTDVNMSITRCDVRVDYDLPALPVLARSHPVKSTVLVCIVLQTSISPPIHKNHAWTVRDLRHRPPISE